MKFSPWNRNTLISFDFILYDNYVPSNSSDFFNCEHYNIELPVAYQGLNTSVTISSRSAK